MLFPFSDPEIIAYSALLAESYARWTGKPLTDSPNPAWALFYAPFALVSHGVEQDPIFRYANDAALRLWAMSWDEFTRMPSRLSAEPVLVPERQRLLTEAALKGYVENYQGVRIAKDGKRFLIRDTVLWNVVDRSGVVHGQACVIRDWISLPVPEPAKLKGNLIRRNAHP